MPPEIRSGKMHTDVCIDTSSNLYIDNAVVHFEESLAIYQCLYIL